MRGSVCLTLPRGPGPTGWKAQRPRTEPNTTGSNNNNNNNKLVALTCLILILVIESLNVHITYLWRVFIPDSEHDTALLQTLLPAHALLTPIAFLPTLLLAHTSLSSSPLGCTEQMNPPQVEMRS